MINKILSISVAAYNVAEYLEYVFDILDTSKYVQEVVEIIIVNDGSKDNTVEIAREYQKKYPDSVVVIDKENGGYGSTINASLRVAKGKYYKLLDGDDWFESNTIKSFLNFLDNCDADLVLSPYLRVYEENNITELINRHNKDNVLDDFLHMAEICVKTSKIVSLNESITEKCFYTDVEYALLVMMVSNTIKCFDEIVYCYRIGKEGQSVSVAGRIRHYKDNEKVLNTINSWYTKYNKTMNESQKQLFRKQIVVSSIFQFETYFLFSENKRQELICFDKMLNENNHDTYEEMSKKSKFVKIVRILNYRFYRVISKYKKGETK